MSEHKDSPPAILVKDLHKNYGATRAVRGISFDVSKGEIFGMIGPDGAGKTTTFQILAGVMEASSGVAEIFGRPARAMRSQTGYLTQAFSLYPDLSVSENIRYIGDLREVPPEQIENRGRRYLEMFDMDRFTERLAGQLSGGMKQKLALVCALVPEPRVLLLDEPTTGVDPMSRREFWTLLHQLHHEGLTIVVSTPYMDEAEYASRLGFLHEGRLLDVGTRAEILGRYPRQLVEVHTHDRFAVRARLATVPDIDDVSLFGTVLHVRSRESATGNLTTIVRDALAGMVPAKDIASIPPSLEDVFVLQGERTEEAA